MGIPRWTETAVTWTTALFWLCIAGAIGSAVYLWQQSPRRNYKRTRSWLKDFMERLP